MDVQHTEARGNTGPTSSPAALLTVSTGTGTGESHERLCHPGPPASDRDSRVANAGHSVARGLLPGAVRSGG